MLLHFGIIPYIVFDGDYLPSKAVTEVERAKRREESKKKGLELYNLNKPSQAHLELQKAVDVTPEMARQFIDELKKMGVQYVVAPYEADAQLVYLERKGIVQGILSEDSDLLVFGAKCLLTKFDQYGDCIEVNRADFTACREISLVGWSDAEFRRMAILSGCDYLASIDKMGLKSAYRLVRKYKTIEKILQMLQFDGKHHVPTGYLEAFRKAELTFIHQRVFCPVKNDIVMMTDLENGVPAEKMPFIGDEVEQTIAVGVAKGDLDPMTKQPIFVKSRVNSTPKTLWSNPHRHIVKTCSESKPNKPIDAFFKAKRTPLAELDPNCFIPSPTQRGLLQHASGASWDSSPAPAGIPNIQSSTSRPPSTPRSVLSSRYQDAPSDTSLDDTKSSPSKRRKLCVEPAVGQKLGCDQGAAVRSRFFASNAPDPSALIQSTKIKRKAKLADIAIWSDDSIEDVMAELPDVTDFTKPSAKTGEKTIHVDSQEQLQDHSRPKAENELKQEDPPSSTVSGAIVTSEASVTTQTSSFTNADSPFGQTFDKHVTAELAAITQNYIYQPEIEQVSVKERAIEDSKKPRKIATANHRDLKPLHRQRSMTPLQRLGIGALNRWNSCSGFLNSAASSKAAKSLPVKESIILGPCKSGPPGLPTVHSIGPDASVGKGSEDAMVPDSEESAEEPFSGSETEQQGKPILDLGRFAFAA